MTSSKSILSTLAGILVKALSRETTAEPVNPRRPHARLRPDGRGPVPDARSTGSQEGTQTVRIDPDSVPDLAVGYSPSRNRLPDSGEVIWTWVPYEENDGRGKDRPVLVIGRQSRERVYAVRMTSRSHDGDRDYVPIGAGEWDSRGRESWVDIEQLYSVHTDGMRREAAVLDERRYARVAQSLISRYGWARA